MNTVLGRIEADFQMYPTPTFDFGSEVNAFQTGKNSAQVSAVLQLTVSLQLA